MTTRPNLIEPGKWYTEFDENGYVTAAVYDASFRRLLGYENEAEYADAQKTWRDSVHPDDLERLNAHLEECLQKHPEGMDFDIEYRMMTRWGYRWFHDFAVVTRRPDGSVIRADGAAFDIQDAVERRDLHESIVETNLRVLALEDEFESLYDVDLETGRYDVFIKGATFGEINTKLQNRNDFFGDTALNVEQVVYPDDREGVLAKLTPENIRAELENASHFDWYYRLLADGKPLWVRMRVVYKNEEKRSIIVGVFNAAREVGEKEKDEAIRTELLNGMLGDDGVFLIDCAQDTRRTVHDSLSGATHYSDGEPFSVAFGRYVETCVARADRPMMRKYVYPSTLLECVQTEKDHVVRYRDITTDTPVYIEMRIARFSETEVLQSFVLKDHEVLQNMVMGKLIDKYDAIYLADLNRKELRSVRSSRASGVGHYEGVKPYTPMFERFAETVAPEYRQDWLSFSDPEYMKKYMEGAEHREYIYVLPEAEHSMRRMNIDVVERVTGEVSLVLLSFMAVDDERAKTLLQQKKAAEQKVLLDCFVASYVSAFSVDLKNNRFEVLHLERDIADAFEMTGNAREGITKFIMNFIVPEDREPMLRMIDPEYVVNRLKTESSYTFTVRENLHGELRILRGLIIRVADEYNIAIGFMDITEEIRREQEHKAQLEAAPEKAREAVLRNEMLYNVSPSGK